MPDVKEEAANVIATAEPPSALLIGGVLGAMTFLLCALLFGARAGIVIAALGVVVALARRIPSAAMGFAIATALSTAGLIPSTTALIAAAAMFGLALALFAQARMRQRLAASISSINAASIGSS